MFAKPSLRVISAFGVCFMTIVSALPNMVLPEHDIFSHPNITFLMYPTPESADEPLTGDPDVLIPQHPLTVVFHGFKGDRTAKSMEVLKEALLDNGVQNVVVVDWGPLADAPNMSALDSYHHVCQNGTRDCAILAHEWLLTVMELKGIGPDMLHLIGFSLGAHVVGMVGSLFNNSIARLSALDPPKFGYENTPLEQRLDAEDAQFVNVIHTSAGILSYPEPIGHVDFFPNGDVVPQVGCPEESPIHIITCSHYFSFSVFAESIYFENAFVATECGSWQAFVHGDCADRPTANMGFYTPATTRGMFFMETHDKPPFGTEGVENPLPERMKELLVYDKEDSFVKPSDVVGFLMHKEPELEEKLDETLEEEIEERKVMKVKSKSHTTTTADPPAFQNGSPSPFAEAFDFLLISLASINLVRLFLEWVFSR